MTFLVSHGYWIYVVVNLLSLSGLNVLRNYNITPKSWPCPMIFILPPNRHVYYPGSSYSYSTGVLQDFISYMYYKRSVVPQADIKGRDKLLHSILSVRCNYLSLSLIHSSRIIPLMWVGRFKSHCVLLIFKWTVQNAQHLKYMSMLFVFFLSAYLSACSLCLQACKYGILNYELVLYLSCDDDTPLHAITITVNNFETAVIFRHHCD